MKEGQQREAEWEMRAKSGWGERGEREEGEEREGRSQTFSLFLSVFQLRTRDSSRLKRGGICDVTLTDKKKRGEQRRELSKTGTPPPVWRLFKKNLHDR